MTSYLYVKNWENYQHYKHRSPPWIKLHRDLLNDYNFLCLQDASKLHLMLIWLLASQMENRIPADPDFIRQRIGIKEKPNLKELIDKGFLVDASNALASCKQVAITETETETETDKKPQPVFVLPDWIPPDLWDEHQAIRRKLKAQNTDKAKWLLVARLEQFSIKGHDVRAIMEASIENSWKSFFEPKGSNYAKQPTKDDRLKAAIMRGLEG
jgi:hypothetical protein